MFNRRIYFAKIRPLFGDEMNQLQVDGQEAIIGGWENLKPDADRRRLGYMLATTYWETAHTMQPIEEIGKGAGRPYGRPHPTTGQTYYGRGYVQLTWYDNYLLAETKLGLPFTTKPALVMIPKHAFAIMYLGMHEGWFRKGHNLERYFNLTTDDPFSAREIINGDKHITPKWSSQTIGSLIKDAYMQFTAALNSSYSEDEKGEPVPPLEPTPPVVSERPPVSPIIPPSVPSTSQDWAAMLQVLLPALIKQLVPIIIKQVTAAVQNPNVPISSPSPSRAGAEIADAVADDVAQLPEVQHATNTEPWYKSRVTWGAIISALAGLLALFGLNLDLGEQETMIDTALAIGAVVGALISLYGRWKARVPLGETPVLTA